MTAEGMKEKFMIQPELEDRPITDEELDALLDGYQSGTATVTGKTHMIIKTVKEYKCLYKIVPNLIYRMRNRTKTRYGTNQRT